MRQKHKIVTVALLSMGGIAAASAHQPPPDSAAPKELIELRSKLLGTERAQVKADIGRFRALCDDEGYPLVGNVANKGNRYQPSELCADLRKGKTGK